MIPFFIVLSNIKLINPKSMVPPIFETSGVGVDEFEMKGSSFGGSNVQVPCDMTRGCHV